MLNPITFLLWKLNNRHNFTSPGKPFNKNIVSVGNYTYGIINVHSSGDKHLLKIGSFCSISNEVLFLLSDHNYKLPSTYPFKTLLFNNGPDAIAKGDIIVKDDVWIGYRSIILSGVTIGQGAVVAAGSVVTKDVPPYAIVGGNPAKIIKYRFSDNKIKELLKIDYSKIDKDYIKNNLDYFYKES